MERPTAKCTDRHTRAHLVARFAGGRTVFPEWVYTFTAWVRGDTISNDREQYLPSDLNVQVETRRPKSMWEVFDAEKFLPYTCACSAERDEELTRTLLRLRDDKVAVLGFLDVTFGLRPMRRVSRERGVFYVVEDVPLEMSLALSFRGVGRARFTKRQDEVFQMLYRLFGDSWRWLEDVLHILVCAPMSADDHCKKLDRTDEQYDQTYEQVFRAMEAVERDNFWYVHNIPYITD
jgi:hypothetical protein